MRIRTSSAIRPAVMGAFAVAAISLATLALPSAAPAALAAGMTRTVFRQVGTVRLNGENTATYCWYDLTEQRYVGYNHSNGTQIPTNSSCIGTFIRQDGFSSSGLGWYEYQSVQSGYCAKLDPGISGDPVVSSPCDYGRSTATEQEEHWSDPPVMQNFYEDFLMLGMNPSSLSKLSASQTPNDFSLSG
jgi:hypothetical protein